MTSSAPTTRSWGRSALSSKATDWPFFEDRHREFAAFATAHLPDAVEDDLDARCRGLVRALARDGWLQHAVGEPLDVRTLCLARETLARHEGLADFAFAMQGLGSGPISLFGDDDQRARYLPAVAAGDKIAAFALSEPDAGSDVAAMTTSVAGSRTSTRCSRARTPASARSSSRHPRWRSPSGST
jgi:alkylation response protein AidB-like acyl-CoA dehydrogenase